MGEIADMMLEGEMCGMCGVYLEDDGDGIPAYCSTECAVDANGVWSPLHPDFNNSKGKTKRV